MGLCRLVAFLSLLHNGIHIVPRFKENLVPNAPAEQKIPEEALNAFLDGILSELASPADPAMLTRVRAIFRKRIPLHLRSYAASILIMRAAGVTRMPAPKAAPGPVQNKPAVSSAPAASPRRAPRPTTRDIPAKDAAAKIPPAKEAPAEPRSAQAPKLAEPTIPLFVSMGKRQRLRPQELRTLISEKTGILTEELGRVHLFDNYSFIDVQESHAEKIIAATDGISFKGRNLEIKPAKKRNESSDIAH